MENIKLRPKSGPGLEPTEPIFSTGGAIDRHGRDVFEAGGLGPGDQLDGYRLIRRLGQGGMGVVFDAQEVADPELRVAIKILKPLALADDARERFKLEQQVMRRLDHPGIAQWLGGGTTPQGLPYFVMQLVEAMPVDAYCDEQCLGIAERLELIEKVLEPLHFAHQHDVLHRDIKPQHVVVNEWGEVTILDFGIAKVTAQNELVDSPILTQVGSRALTLAYAAPEQILGMNASIATDIYQVGLLIYKLLCGKSPYSLEGLPLHVAERIVCHARPMAPSRALTQLSDAELQECARQRGITPAELRTAIEPWDHVVLACLRKSPARRIGCAQRLAEAIRSPAGSNESSSSTPAPRGASWGRRCPFFVGRARELEALAEALDAAGEGICALHVHGPAGIGKTTLIKEFCEERAQQADDRVLWAEADALGDTMLGALLLILRQWLGNAATQRDALIHLAPSWALQFPWLLTVDQLRALEEQTRGNTPYQLTTEFAALLRHIADDATVVVVLENLDGADHCSKRIVRALPHVMRSIPGGKVLLIATSRSDRIQCGDGEDCLTFDREMILGPLDLNEVRDYVASNVAGDDATALAAELWHISSGEPLLLTALAEEVNRRGATERRALPSSLPALLRDQLARLPESIIHLLSEGAVCGPHFCAALVAGEKHSTEAADAELMAFSREATILVYEGVETWEDGTVSGCYRFRHEALRRYFYDLLAPAQRAAVHLRTAERLAHGLGSEVYSKAETIAEHFQKGGDYYGAARFYLKAAHDAVRFSAAKAARDTLERSLELASKIDLTRNPKAAHLIASLRASTACTSLYSQGVGGPTVEAMLREAEQLLGAPLEACEMHPVRVALAFVYQSTGQYDKAKRVIRDLTLCDSRPDVQIQAHALFSCMGFHNSRFDASLEHAQAVIDGMGENLRVSSWEFLSEHPAIQARAWGTLSATMAGREYDARRLETQLLHLTSMPQFAYTKPTAHVLLGFRYQLLGNAQKVLEHARIGEAEARRRDNRYRTWEAQILMVWGDAQGGLDRTADAELALAQVRDLGVTVHLPYLQSLLAASHLCFGRSKIAVPLLEEALEIATEDYFYLAEIHRILGLAAAASNNGPAATEAFATARSIAQQNQARLVLDRVENQATD